jgi:hypothetical protein
LFVKTAGIRVWEPAAPAWRNLQLRACRWLQPGEHNPVRDEHNPVRDEHNTVREGLKIFREV